MPFFFDQGLFIDYFLRCSILAKHSKISMLPRLKKNKMAYLKQQNRNKCDKKPSELAT